MTPLAVDLWCVDLRVGTAVVDGCEQLLDDDERARARRLAFDRDRRRFLVHHAAARFLVSRAAGVPARELRWSPGPRGRPAVAGHALAVSLSRSDEAALVAITAGGRVGVDLEVMQDIRPDPAWLDGHVDPAALAREAAGAPATSPDWFYRGWTRVEALAKARGTGIAWSPASGWDPWRTAILAALSDDEDRLRDWQVRELEIGTVAGLPCRAALATDGAPGPVRLHRLADHDLRAWLDAVGHPGLATAR